MNKDVIYIEPEDDITDIVAKIKNSKEKIVALVPPKKATVMRSIVNIKLIAKSSQAAGKSVVLVTTDPSIVKLAAATKMPVTKNLQSAPSVPTAAEVTEEETVSRETLVEENGEVKTEEAPAETTEDDDIPELAKDTKPAGEILADDKVEATKPEKTTENSAFDKAKKEADKLEDDKKKPEKEAKHNNPVINWILAHRVIAICCGVGVVLLILILVWAFAIAPAATVTVDLRTTSNNFSENATFTTNPTEENASEGKFYLAEKKLETKTEVEFTPTGTKNIGAKATGEVIIYAYFRDNESIAVNAGSEFTNNGLTYISERDATLSWNKQDPTDCDNNGQASAMTSGCLISARVPVVAAEPGARYNISANDFGWSTAAPVAVYSDRAMSGGTDETVTVVSESDIEDAKTKLESSGESANKEKLIKSVDEGNLVITSTFKQTVGDAVSSPAVGEKVEDGKKAKLSVTTTDTIYYVDLTKLEEFIREKAKLAENYKIYEMNDPFIENFLKVDDKYTGKIKTSYVSGPEVTENNIIEVVKGKGVGTAQHDLSEINGIGKIKIETSFPWVSTIPNDPEKITVNINVEE